MKKIISLLSLCLINGTFAAPCRPMNSICTDRAETKIFDGVTIRLADVCNNLGLRSDKCCWDYKTNIYCGDAQDTCGSLRRDPNCSIQENTCLDKDQITGTCNKFQSTYKCASGFRNVEEQYCTNVVCANTESSTAQRCFSPPVPTDKSNESNFGQAVAYLGMAQNMAQALKCSDPAHPTADSCSLFAGKYNYCYMYLAKGSQPDSFYNNGADCSVRKDYFDQVGAQTGLDASDRNLYSSATSNSTNITGGIFNYGLSSDHDDAINNSLAIASEGKNQLANPDENTGYNPNSSKNSSIHPNNGQITSTINKDKVKDISSFTAFKAYLADTSVNLAWNRIKAEKNPAQVHDMTLQEMGITRRPTGSPFSWHGGSGKPIINGLCVHFGDFCDGGDDKATNSDLVKSSLAAVGAYINPNFCAHCDAKDPVFHKCLAGSPRPTKQQWCCFDSKVALDINLAAYDQGLINFYTGGDKYSSQLINQNGGCGGVKVSDISRIDFSKADYFKDLMNSIDMNKIVDQKNFTDVSVQNRTKNRSGADTSKFVDDWKKKQ